MRKAMYAIPMPIKASACSGLPFANENAVCGSMRHSCSAKIDLGKVKGQRRKQKDQIQNREPHNDLRCQHLQFPFF